MITNVGALSINHWTLEGFRQRITTKQWKVLLMDKGDQIFVNGELRQLKAKRLSSGVVEVFKAREVVPI